MMTPQTSSTSPSAGSLSGHAVIAGFGLPGRSLEEELSRRGVPCVVIETNPDVVARCRRAHHVMVCGDARSESVLREAGIERAAWLAVVIPAEEVVLDVIRAARSLNPTLRILARTAFTSTGMEAMRLGAAEVVVAEQVVAREVVKMLERVDFGTTRDGLSPTGDGVSPQGDGLSPQGDASPG